MLFSCESNLFERCFADLSLRDLFLPHDWLMSNLRADQKRTGALKTPHAKAHHFGPERYLKAPCSRLITGESRREERNLVKSNQRRTGQSGPFSGAIQGSGSIFYQAALSDAYVTLLHCVSSALADKKIAAGSAVLDSLNRP